MKARRKWFKFVLVSKIEKLGPAFLVPKLEEFLLFDSFLDLANFSLFDFPDLDNFRAFDFPVFLAYFILSPKFIDRAIAIILPKH